ncbi:MAG: nucleotidyltransferase domain-containing protein [Candidatus Bipolaricaulota bacterium]|nr:nucleotidyltransferase domain-containing protein [Candidatus Bipolaricaulota bacterium]
MEYTEWAVYHATALQRRQQAYRRLEQRRSRAWQVAYQAAHLLKQRFGATRVVLFGSLARHEGFSLWSDVDLAAWGLRPDETFRAVVALIELDPEIAINLVDMAVCRPDLRAVIEQEGVEL